MDLLHQIWLVKLTAAFRRSKRPAKQVFQAAVQWLAETDALTKFSDQDLGKFAMDFDNYLFDVETQVSRQGDILCCANGHASSHGEILV